MKPASTTRSGSCAATASARSTFHRARSRLSASATATAGTPASRARWRARDRGLSEPTATTRAPYDGSLKVEIGGTVHPDHRGRGIGSQLVPAMIDRAREYVRERGADLEPVVAATAPADNTDLADIFARQLQSRLLSALSSQIVDAIFGENPQERGTISFGGQTINFVRGLENVTLTITNDDTGEVTTIIVPTFINVP